MTEHQLNSLFSALRAGDRDAFRSLYDALSPPVYTVLLWLVGDRQSAEDLLQETFLRLYRTPPVPPQGMGLSGGPQPGGRPSPHPQGRPPAGGRQPARTPARPGSGAGCGGRIKQALPR